jgi:hypothetical protein
LRLGYSGEGRPRGHHEVVFLFRDHAFVLRPLVAGRDEEPVLLGPKLLVHRRGYLDAPHAVTAHALAEQNVGAGVHAEAGIEIADPLVDLAEQRSSSELVANA